MYVEGQYVEGDTASRKTPVLIGGLDTNGAVHVLSLDTNGSIAAGAVTVADGADVAQGAKADAAVTNPALSASEISLLKGLVTLLNAGLPAALTSGGGLKVGIVDALPASSNVIGHVITDQTPPAAPTTDGVGMAWRVKEAYSGLTAATLSVGSTSENAGWASIAAGTTENVVAAVTSKKIGVHGAVVMAQAATAGTFQFFDGATTGAATTAISPAFNIGDTGGVGRGFVLPPSPIPWFEIGTAGHYLTATATTVGAHVIVIASAY